MSLTRRSFLKGLVATAAAVALLRAVPDVVRLPQRPPEVTEGLSLDQLQAAYLDASDGEWQPSGLVTDSKTFDRYYNCLDDCQKLCHRETSEQGLANLLFNGKPLIRASKLPTGSVHVLPRVKLGNTQILWDQLVEAL